MSPSYYHSNFSHVVSQEACNEKEEDWLIDLIVAPLYNRHHGKGVLLLGTETKTSYKRKNSVYKKK